MKVIGYKSEAAPSGMAAVAVACNYGKVWIDPRLFFVGRRDKVSRREIVSAVKNAPYGRSYVASGVGGLAFEQTHLAIGG